MSASAKQTVQSAYSRLFPNAKNKDLFESIDEKEIEKNIPLAENVIERNLVLNPVNQRTFEKLPYLKYGLATFYAATFSGNHEAANAARKLAYTEDENEDKEKQKNSLNFSAMDLKQVENATDIQQNESYATPKTAINSYNSSNGLYFTNLSNDDGYFVFGQENQPVAVKKQEPLDGYMGYLSKNEILPVSVFNSYILSGLTKKQDADSLSSENQIISTLDAATLADSVYALSKHDGSIPKGTENWKYEESYSNSEGLQIAVFSREENGKTYYAVVNAGTEGKVKNIETAKEFMSDWTNNFQQPFGKSDDMKDSIAFAEKFVAEHPDSEIVFIGHSKGGAEAAANAIKTNCNAIIFNPSRANFGAYDLKMDEYDKSIQAYVVDGEFIESLLGELPETYYDVTKLDEPSSFEKVLKKIFGYSIPGAIYNIADSIDRHKMKSIIHKLGKESAK